MIDHHAHPVSLHGGPLEPAELGLDVGSDEGAGARRRSTGPFRLFQELLGVRLAARLGCAVEELPQARAEAARDWPAYARGLFADAGIEGILMDGGVAPGDAAADDPLRGQAEVTGCAIHPIARFDPLVDRLVGEGAGAAEIVETVRGELAGAAERGAVGFKTILAYRTGLRVDPSATTAQAESSLRSDEPVRRRGKACRDLVMRGVLELAADLGRPLQIHTGLGDSEIRLGDANPLLLEDLLHSPAGSAAPVVLIHGSYPWHEELAYLAATRPNVWADVSLSTIFAPATVGDRLLRLLELAPVTKVMMATDGHLEPELFWFGALVLRDAWREARGALSSAGARDGWLDDAEDRLFAANARELYGL